MLKIGASLEQTQKFGKQMKSQCRDLIKCIKENRILSRLMTRKKKLSHTKFCIYIAAMYYVPPKNEIYLINNSYFSYRS